MSLKLLTETLLEFLSLKGVCTGMSESTLVVEITCHGSICIFYSNTLINIACCGDGKLYKKKTDLILYIPTQLRDEN